MTIKKRYFGTLLLFLLATAATPSVAQGPGPLLTDPEAPPGTRYAESRHLRQQSSEQTEKAYTGFDNKTPIDLSADSLQHDETGQIITAAGNVELVQEQRILKADRIEYNLQTDTVTARGNIALMEPNGDVHFADEVQLSRRMSSGFVNGLQSYLSAGGRFIADEGRRDDKVITMTDASYTPCECEEDEDGDPSWQIKADKIIYDENANKISYRNAQFELFGVPVLFSPYLAHPDGKVKRKSGFLTPQIGYDSQLGAVLTSNYYWDIAPNRDATFGVMAMTEEVPVALAEYRHRFKKAELELSGSATYSERVDQVAGRDIRTDEEFRGHLFADGLWDINEKWRAGTTLELTTDEQYLRQYDFSSKDVLENEIYVERFSGRNYGAARLLAFQDVRVDEPETDQPNVLPEIEASFVGEPNKTLGGRWDANISALSLQREGNGQDMNRIVTELGWQKRHVSGGGLITTVDASVRGDAYHVSDRNVATLASGRSRDGEETRFFPRVHAVTSYPVAKPMETMQAVIEPVAALTVSPDINSIDSDIPNEDSQDVQIDANNLFEPNRFAGKDRIEDGVHATYGVRSGLFGYGGSYIDTFIGQSYRFDDDNPFPDGSGLSTQESDVVGQIAGVYDGRFGLNYRFQLDSRDFNSQRHEFDGYAHWDRLSLSTRYLFAKALDGTDITESREQVENYAAYKVTNKWRLRGGALHDLGADPGLRKASVGVDYLGCCVSFSATAERNLTTDSSGDSGTDITFRIGLKGLGEFNQGSSGGFSANNKAR